MRLLKMMLVFVAMTFFLCCRHKAADGGGEIKKIDPEDFQAMFRTFTLPVNFADSSLSKKSTDSPLAFSIFTQFIDDSLIQKHFGKAIKPRLFAVGKITIKNAETYLFFKALSPDKKFLFIACLDKD